MLNLPKKANNLFYKCIEYFKKKNSSVKLVIIIITTLSLWMLSGIFKFNHKRENMEEGKISVPVRIEDSKAEEHFKVFRLEGILKADKRVSLKAEHAGRVVDKLVKQGTYLHKGDKIMSIDPKNTSESLEQTRSNLEEKRIAYSSTLSLYNKGLSSKVALTAATSTLRDAESRYKAALIAYENSYLKAPFDGIVDQIYVDEGELVSQESNVSLCSFIAIDPIIAVLNVAEQDIAQVSKKAEVYISSLDGTSYAGKINFISQIADPATLSFMMEVSVVNKDHKLLPGQSINAILRTDKMLAHKLPLSALSLDDKGILSIKVLDGENAVVAKPIEIIDEEDGNIWVLGLDKEERIIVIGSAVVKPGQKLQA